MRELIKDAKARGIQQIIAEYRPTERNVVVAGLFEELGFSPTRDGLWLRKVGAANTEDLEHSIIQASDHSLEALGRFISIPCPRANVA